MESKENEEKNMESKEHKKIESEEKVERSDLEINRKLNKETNEIPSKEEVTEVFSHKNNEQPDKEVKDKIPFKESFEKNYDRYYKLILLIPVIFFVLCLAYLYSFQSVNGDIILKDISLSGGTSIQVSTQTDLEQLRISLEQNFEDISVKSIQDFLSGEQLAILIETTAEPEDITPFLEDYFGFELTSENSSIEFTGSSLSDSFYNQLRIAILFSFILMAIVVFIIFRKAVPSAAVVFAALADIIMTLTIVNLLGMKVSTAGIVAFLMLIGYSVDTDILLTTRVIKRSEGSLNSRIFGAFKTGILMTLTSLLVVRRVALKL